MTYDKVSSSGAGCWSSVQTSTHCWICSSVRILGTDLAFVWCMPSSTVRIFWHVPKPIPIASHNSQMVRHQFSWMICRISAIFWGPVLIRGLPVWYYHQLRLLSKHFFNLWHVTVCLRLHKIWCKLVAPSLLPSWKSPGVSACLQTYNHHYSVHKLAVHHFAYGFTPLASTVTWCCIVPLQQV